jgi:hypothetical protein
VFEQTSALLVDENGAANLIFSLGGRPTGQASNSSATDDDGNNINVVLWVAVIGVLLVLLGILFLAGRRNTPPLAQ